MPFGVLKHEIFFLMPNITVSIGRKGLPLEKGSDLYDPARHNLQFNDETYVKGIASEISFEYFKEEEVRLDYGKISYPADRCDVTRAHGHAERKSTRV